MKSNWLKYKPRLATFFALLAGGFMIQGHNFGLMVLGVVLAFIAIWLSPSKKRKAQQQQPTQPDILDSDLILQQRATQLHTKKLRK